MRTWTRQADAEPEVVAEEAETTEAAPGNQEYLNTLHQPTLA